MVGVVIISTLRIDGSTRPSRCARAPGAPTQTNQAAVFSKVEEEGDRVAHPAVVEVAASCRWLCGTGRMFWDQPEPFLFPAFAADRRYHPHSCQTPRPVLLQQF